MDPISAQSVLAAAGAGGNSYDLVVAIAHRGSDRIQVYEFSKSTGFGTQYSAPSTLPTGNTNSCKFTPDKSKLIVAHFTSPYVTAYPWSNSSGFGTKYSNPSTLPSGTGYSVAVNSNSDRVLLASDNSPYLHAYQISSSGWGTKFSNPSTLPAGRCFEVAFAGQGGAVIAAMYGASPYKIAYSWSDSSGFGSKYTDPSATAGATVGCDGSPDGNHVAFTHIGDPVVSAYPWSNSSGFGTKHSNPSTIPNSIAYDVAFSPDSDYVCYGGLGGFFVYPWSSSGFGTAYTQPAYIDSDQTSGAGTGRLATWNQDQDVIFMTRQDVSSGDGIGFACYEWSSSGFGTRYSNPSNMTASSNFGVSVIDA